MCRGTLFGNSLHCGVWVREVSGYHICSSTWRMDCMIIAFELVRVSMSTFNVFDVHPFNTTR